MIATLMKPFSEQPNAGQKVRVFLKSNKEVTANCCQVVGSGFHCLEWYDAETGKAIDVNQIKGWMPSI